jgi:acyl transferase domain-containing protein
MEQEPLSVVIAHNLCQRILLNPSSTGDPIECAAVGNVFASSRSPEKPLLLTSLKSNIGHTESASGLASIIKVVLSLEKGLIPPIVGIKTPNPKSG